MSGGIFQRLGTVEGRLMRLELVVLTSALILGALVLHDNVHGRRGRVSVLRSVMAVAYPTSYVVVAYAVGLIQDGPFHDETFVLWAAALLVIQASIMSTSEQRVLLAIQPAASGGGRCQHGCGDAQRKKLLLQHLLQTGLVLWLIVNASARNRYYRAAIWTLWALNLLKIGSKVVEITIAHQPDVSVRVVAEYMAEHVADDDYYQYVADPATMQGYPYIFHGEEVMKPVIHTGGHRIRGNMLFHSAARRSVVTIDEVYRWIDQQRGSEADKDRARDLCLAFALFKLLKRRFYGYIPAEAGSEKARSLVLNLLIQVGTTGPDAAFRVVEAELAFLYAFLYSVNTTLVGPKTHICVAIAMAAVTICTAFLGTLASNSRRLLMGVPDIGRCITLLIVVIAAGVEVCQAVASIPSDWRYIETVYGCVRDRRPWPGWLRHLWWEKSITPLPLEKRYWEDKVDQYVFLRRFNHKPWNLLSWLTLFLVKPRRQGQKRGQRTPLPREVKRAVLLWLKHSHCQLSHGVATLRKHRLLPRLAWACRLPKVADQILAWHVVTTACDWSCSFRPADRVVAAGDDDDRQRLIATKLSNYCAYLVAFVPEMLPDPSYNAEQIFDTAVLQARDHLDGCRTQSSIVARLEDIEAEERRYVQDSGTYDRAAAATVIERAAVLWGQLREAFGGDDERRWELLAEFWTELLLFLAPSDNVDIHAEMLGAGGEFMTQLWALLSHAGVLERPPVRQYTY